jgi:WD40 repeat protein
MAAIIGYKDAAIRLYDVKSGKLVHCLKNKFLTGDRCCSSLEFALSDALLKVVAADASGTFKECFWDVKSGQCVLCLEDVCCLSLSSDSSLMAGCKDNSICVWSVDKRLEDYLSKEISIDQALLLLLAFKAHQKNENLVIDESSTLKTLYNSITHKELQSALCNSCIKYTGGWTIQDETAAIADDYMVRGIAPANFIGAMDRTCVDGTAKDESLPKKRKRNSALKK